ncbi:Zinc finger BED domain-containing protein 1 [Acipenser ruthenus]|uniref:Zinc finger BED domain-containing protein 1 n=1 Tax=Acipenser ruthenus TaxID=7906 RepID=A0A662YPH9_ACIRT|nr:Zinc finger BED domain-containing protein 1 [Acipenser ruthenus]
MSDKSDNTAGRSAPERTIVTPPSMKSKYWRHFGFWTIGGQIENKKNVVCKLCKRELPYNSNTANIRHLEKHHPLECSEIHGKEEGSETAGPSCPKQPRMTAFFQQTSAAALPGQRSEAITKSLVKFICKDMRPISIVEGDGFREFCSEMESRYKIPSRTTISKNIIKLYDTTRANVKQILHDCKDIALTTDGWTSLATDAYVTVTAHCITDSWELQDFVLQTKELRGSHTAENVAECISEILDDFNIRESVIAVTTDNALNYVNAVERYLNLINIPCVAHTINLAVRKGLNTGPIERTLTRLKSSAAHFNRSPTDKCLLEDKQKLLGLKNDNLINDCVTRWNSTYGMICRASEQQAAVAAVIFEKKLSHLELTTNEWMVVENIRETLKPFKTATAALSTDKYPTAPAVLPLQHILINQVKNFAASEIPVIKEMKNKIYSDLSLRYDKEERQSTFVLLNKTSFFDPRFHRLIHLSEQEKRQVQEEIQTEVIQRFVNETDLLNEHGSSENKEASRKTALSAMGDLFGDTYTCGQEETKNCEIQLMQEMACYRRHHSQQIAIHWNGGKNQA